jgi:DNA-binding MarR family transcriptional regulator
MVMSKPSPSADALRTHEIAEKLHSGALRLLRRLRKFDSEAQISAPKLSALSVLVFGGPQSLTDLAAAEQVRAPTMSRLVAELEADGLVRKSVDAKDKRAVKIATTAKGQALMELGRARRLQHLTAAIAHMSAEERKALALAGPLMLKLASA